MSFRPVTTLPYSPERWQANLAKISKDKQEYKRRKKKRKRSPADFLAWLCKKAKGLNYKDFLDSQYWKVVKSIVLKRDNFKCAVCQSKNNLQVHHSTYKHHFKEHLHLEDLTTLCADCHKEYHYCIEK